MGERGTYLAAALVAGVGLACGPAAPPPEPPPTPEVLAVHPGIVLPGTRLVIEGRGFADSLGTTRVAMKGTSASGTAIESWIPAVAESSERVVVEVDRALWDQLGAGAWTGELVVVVDVAGSEVVSTPYATALDLREHLDPASPQVDVPELLYINDLVLVVSDGLLLPGEGQSQVRLDGCVRPNADPERCEPVADVPLVLEPVAEFDRSAGAFAWSPALAGITAGRFEGEVRIENRHLDDEIRASDAAPMAAAIAESTLFGPGQVKASLGQFIDIDGAGFVASDERGATLLSFVGQLDRGDGTEPVDLDLLLVPKFESGRSLRYVLAEDDALGKFVDLRAETASLTGQLRVVVEYDDEVVESGPLNFGVDIASVKQVVYLDFSDGYKRSLGLFGMTAADQLVRERIATVIARDYAGVNLEVRLEEPTDFALYAVVEVGGADPNGLGLLGNDNTPGKDVGNIRLHDRLGGVNAVTQFDGFPGYGGVFIESLFVYSKAPVGDYRGIDTSATADPLFDQVFDEVRPDRGGEPIVAADLQGLAVPTSGGVCPPADRKETVECAIWVLGSLVGTTVSHEVGHSLGLADPFGAAFHNFGDLPNRIMDRGAARPFAERAELEGQGPGVFCESQYHYLQTILPAGDDPLAGQRPGCD